MERFLEELEAATSKREAERELLRSTLSQGNEAWLHSLRVTTARLQAIHHALAQPATAAPDHDAGGNHILKVEFHKTLDEVIEQLVKLASRTLSKGH